MSEHEESSHGVARNGDRDRDLREEAHSQVPEGGDAAERVGHAAGEAVVGEVQRLQPRQRAQLRRQPAGDVVVLQQPGKKKQKARRTGGGAVTAGRSSQRIQ